MIKAIYMHPNADLDYFRKHHIAMTNALPGLRRFAVNLGIPDPVSGDAPLYNLVNEVVFDDLDAYRRAFTSKEIEIALGDVPNFSDASAVVAVLTIEDQVFHPNGTP